jgi:hypothetical protein
MKKHNFFYFAMLVAIGLTLNLTSCKEDEDPTPLTLATLTAGDIDLNGATAPNNVPSEPTITATFSTDVDATTAIAANITLVRDYDDTNIGLTITVSGKTITIVPTEALLTGTLHELTLTAALKSTEGEMLTTAVSRTFTTDGFFAPTGMVAHWNFEDNADDQIGDYDASAEIDVTYTDGRKTTAGKAASFNGTTSIIEIPNGDQLMNTSDFTLSFWVKAEESGKGHFIIGLAAFYGFQFELGSDFKWFKMPVQFEYEDGTTGTGGDLSYNGDGLTNETGGWRGTVINEENTALDASLKNTWAHIAYVYDSETKERMMFLNGKLVIKQDYDLWIDDEGVPYKESTTIGLKYGGTAPEVVNELAFGFIQSRAGTLWDTESWGGYDLPGANHFQGQLDDVRIFNKAVSEAEMLLMYNSEKP